MLVRSRWLHRSATLVILCVLIAVGAPTTAAIDPGLSIALASADILIAGGADAQVSPAVTYAPGHDEYLVVWETGMALDKDLQAQRFAWDLTPIGAIETLACGSGGALQPAVAYSPAGHVYVAVLRRSSGLDAYRIQAWVLPRVRVSAAPSADSGESDVIDVTPIGLVGDPAVAVHSVSGAFLVVWSGCGTAEAPAECRIQGRWLSPNGDPIGTPFAISKGQGYAPALAAGDAASPFLVVWERPGEDMGQSSVVGRMISTEGQPMGDEILIATGAFDQTRPAVAYSPNTGSYMVVWQKREARGGPALGLWARHITAQGALQGSPFALGSDPDAANVALTYWPAGDLYGVLWDQPDLDHQEIYWRAFSGLGKPLDEPRPVAADRSSSKSHPAVAADGGASALAVWVDDRDTGESANIYGRALALPQFSGSVARQVASLQVPMRDVPVRLYYSLSADALGEAWVQSVSRVDGGYAVPNLANVPYYDLVIQPPAGYEPFSATSLAGVVHAPDWIRYTAPLGKMPRHGNDFVLREQPTVTATATPSRTATATASPTPSATPTRSPTPSTTPPAPMGRITLPLILTH
jgi:hypothetical protein